MIAHRAAPSAFGQVTDTWELAPELAQYDPRLIALPGIGSNPITGVPHPLKGDALTHSGRFFFPGTDGYVDLGPLTIAAAGEMSFVLVSKLSSLAATYPVVFGMPTTEGSWFEALYSSVAGYGDFGVGTASNGLSASSLTQFGAVIGTEHRIVYTQNTLTDSFLWVNGVQVARGAYNGVSGGTGNATLGQQGSTALSYDYSGEISVFLLFQRKIPDPLAQAISENPMSAFRGIVRNVSVPAAGSGSTGTLAVTTTNDTAAGAGSPVIVGTLARTAANDTVAATGKVTILGTLAKTAANDTVNASGTSGTAVSGTLARANANDTANAVGSPIVKGTLARTNANDSVTAAGTPIIVGSLARTNANDTATAGGTSTVTGTLAKTNANDTVAASGTATSPNASGTVTYTNRNDTAAATGTQTIRGSLAYINNYDRLSGFGVVNNGITFEAALLTGVEDSTGIKKPGIPSGTPEWEKTFLEILTGRRGNAIPIPPAQSLTFSASPTKTECESLYAYVNTVRDALQQLIDRMDG